MSAVFVSCSMEEQPSSFPLCMYGCLEVVKLFLDRGADPNATSKVGIRKSLSMYVCSVAAVDVYYTDAYHRNICMLNVCGSLIVSPIVSVSHRMEELSSTIPLGTVIWRWFGCSWIEAPTRMLE